MKILNAAKSVEDFNYYYNVCYFLPGSLLGVHSPLPQKNHTQPLSKLFLYDIFSSKHNKVSSLPKALKVWEMDCSCHFAGVVGKSTFNCSDAFARTIKLAATFINIEHSCLEGFYSVTEFLFLDGHFAKNGPYDYRRDSLDRFLGFRFNWGHLFIFPPNSQGTITNLSVLTITVEHINMQIMIQ